MIKEKYNFDDLNKIVEKLRSDNGCPWDKEQTHKSLKKCLIEESYETLEAIDLEDDKKIKEELGDVLLQIIMHSQIGKEENRFDINDVIDTISKKMINRHTHIFGDDVANTSEEVLVNWNKIKNEEKGLDKVTHILNDIPKTLPSLMKSFEIQDKVSKIGFDFENKEDVVDKIKEEVDEFLQAIKSSDMDEKEKEMGDILFSLVNMCRFLKIDPEIALQRTNLKFINRFEFMEKASDKKGLNMIKMNLDDLDKMWEEAKNEIG